MQLRARESIPPVTSSAIHLRTAWSGLSSVLGIQRAAGGEPRTDPFEAPARSGKDPRAPRATRFLPTLLLAWSLLTPRPAAAQEVTAETTTTVFLEPGRALNMMVLIPSADVDAKLGEHLELGADYEVDIVSGASVAVVDAPSASVDAISSATVVDQRHVVGGHLGLLGDLTRLDLAYSYGTERDYRSHAFSVSAAAELFGRNSTFQISYARAFDQVCDAARDRPLEPVERPRMPSSEGCFEPNGDRITRDLAIHTFQASWTQAWTPVLATQLVATAQILNGFQGNPYRAVWLGRSSAQEHHPENRARFAAGAGLRLWLEPLEGALQGFARLYRDTWALQSITLETGYAQSLGAGWQARLLGRWYTQSGAFFYSDDYTRFPRGQYFTGDRELSPMDSWSVGLRLSWDLPPDEEGDVLGFLAGLRLALRTEYTRNQFPEFRYDRAPVPNDQMLFATLQVRATF